MEKKERIMRAERENIKIKNRLKIKVEILTVPLIQKGKAKGKKCV
jgi:hypothetical protein